MIDILMATYNGERYVKTQIESILSQTTANWRLIIRDDCSTDNTPRILDYYEKKYPERIIVEKSNEHIGNAKDAFFELMRYSEQNYIMFSDQDDMWLPDKIEKTYRKMVELENINDDVPILVHTDMCVADGKMNIVDDSLFSMQKLNSDKDKLNNLLPQNIVTGCTVMINRALANLTAYEKKGCVMHDWWLALIASCFGKIGFVKESTMLYRQHGDNSVGAKDAKSILYNLRRVFDFKDAKQVVADTYTQAKGFLDVYKDDLSEYKLNIIKKYAEIPSMNKMKRIKTLMDYGFFKYGFFRKLGQLVFV